METDEQVQHSNGNYRALIQNPKSLMELVNKYVRVTVIKDTSFTGFVHSIDPISLSIILSVPKEGEYQTVLLPGHGIMDVSEVIATSNIMPPRRKQVLENVEDLQAKKLKLMAWFKINLLPVTECDENIVFGDVSVLPPYNLADICTDNPVVALQIRKIMEKMPENVAVE